MTPNSLLEKVLRVENEVLNEHPEYDFSQTVPVIAKRCGISKAEVSRILSEYWDQQEGEG